MHPIRPDIKIIASTSALGFLVLFCVWLHISGAGWSIIMTAATRTGVILALLGAFWTFFVKIGWRVPAFRIGGWLSNVPDLRGRWEGTVCRHKNDTPHPFVIEISQTFLSLSFRTFSQNSKGESIAASLFTDDTGEIFQVLSMWRVTTRKVKAITSEDTFYGASFWNISIDGAKKTITDNYFTSREPQTKGIVIAEWKTLKVKNRFQ